MRSVVVYLKTAPPAKDLPAMSAEIVQRNEAFVPKVIAITQGSTVAFPNADPFFHNVFSLSRSATFDLGRYPRGKSRTWRFDRPGLVRVFCNIHSHMSAMVFVLEHGFFTIPGDDGTFHLDGIPPGDQTMVAWHYREGEHERAVTIVPGRETTVDFSLPVRQR